MGTKYITDRQFTNTVHDNLALSLIYENLHWTPKTFDKDFMESADINEGIDYFFLDNNKKLVTTQERFREYKYHRYNDFTIRFEREFNKHDDRKLSEFYKIKADYFVYGIINHSKWNVHLATDFVKYAVIDLKIFKNLMDKGLIIIDRSMDSIFCTIRDGKLVCPINYNKDGSSSFMPIDIKLLKQLFSHTGVILVSKGF